MWNAECDDHKVQWKVTPVPLTNAYITVTNIIYLHVFPTSILRTTHTTGMATDIGICLGRIAKGKPNELWKLQVQIPLLLSFFVGGVAGCAAYAYLRKHAMFVCVGLFGGIGLLYIAVIAHFKEETYWDAMFGSEKTSSRMQSSGSTRTHDKSTSSSAKADSPPAIKPEATAAGAEEVYSTLHVEL